MPAEPCPDPRQVYTAAVPGTASSGNDGILCVDCDSRRDVGPTKTIRGVFWT